MASYISRLSPIPGFPDYTGPHKVGTVDVEIPVSELDSPSPPPDNVDDIHTVQFRIFYPAEPSANGKPISWLPNPQRQHLSGYTKFIGAGPILSEVLSFIPRHLHYTSIPVHKNADILAPDTPNKRWPTVLFSHGLGGSRNAYSHLAGSLASHGAVVVCPEHRDGSAVMSYIRIPGEQDKFFRRRTRKELPYRRMSHEVTPEIFRAREDQLRIRLWELGLVHAAMLSIDRGSTLSNLNTSTPALEPFSGKMHIHEPGSMIFCGHSFGATTITQFLKSTYYAGTPELATIEKPLFVPDEDSEICKQVTERSMTMLLDIWCMPLLAPNSTPLFKLPLPAYADVPTAAGGAAILAVESETFFNWKEHLHTTARALSPDPSAKVITPNLYERPSGIRLSEPNFFYVTSSAHLSQSDFGILFPWLTKMIFNAVEPERALRLNLRAQLQLLRTNNVPIARTWYGDLDEGAHVDKEDIPGAKAGGRGPEDGIHDDEAIFDRSKNTRVNYWSWIDTVGLGGASGKVKAAGTSDEDVAVANQDEYEAMMDREIEPNVESSKLVASTAT